MIVGLSLICGHADHEAVCVSVMKFAFIAQAYFPAVSTRIVNLKVYAGSTDFLLSAVNVDVWRNDVIFLEGVRQVVLDEAGFADTVIARNDQLQAFGLIHQSYLRSEGSIDLTLDHFGFQINDFDEAVDYLAIGVLLGLLPLQCYSRVTSFVEYVALLEFRCFCNELCKSSPHFLGVPDDPLQCDLFHGPNASAECLYDSHDHARLHLAVT